MNDRPTVSELLAAARQFLEKELVPSIGDARLKFQTLITANVLAIVERELETEQSHLEAEYTELSAQLGVSEPVPQRMAAIRHAVCEANQRLCERIRNGYYDSQPGFYTLLKLLRKSVERKLAVANPRYLGGSSNNS
jgi:Domain of unknown function (DUF6285)